MPFYEANVVQACTSSKDVTVDSYWRLTNQLNRFEFNVPIFEQYESGRTFFGLFEPIRISSKISDRHFIARAVAFFVDVAGALPKAARKEIDRDIFPQLENRKLVIYHLIRERSRLLAT